ncbi:MAG TPA: right-handed parallel beta-helix repeat-containing protein [Thermoanaerobaculia bacterium]|nr:right-handed parallel beta-helix repeat-containing protein [Thermoanaerobaculia bacterium]
MAFGVATALVSTGAAFAATCNVPSGTYPTIQSAVNDLNCSTINVAAGTFAEQVTIGRTLKLVGAGPKTVIKAPSVLAPDADGFKNVVEIKGGATVAASDFTVAGPGPGTCNSISSGIAVIGGALLDLDDVTVTDIRDEPYSNCATGWAIRVGTQGGGPPDVGHLIAGHCFLTAYQRGAIRVAGSGSTGQIHQNRIQGTAVNVLYTDGILIFNGALGTVDHNTISGNHCLNDPNCGPNWFGQFQGFGISLQVNPNPGSTVSNNIVHGNDGGISATGGDDVDHNNFSDNLDFGLVLPPGYVSNAHDNTANGMNASCPSGTTSCDGILVLTSTATVGNNTARNNGHSGIEAASGAVGNTLKDITMTGNGSFDAKDNTSGSGTAGTGNTWFKDHCNTSSPSGLCS